MWRWPMIPTEISMRPALVEKARGFAGLEGMDLAKQVTCAQSYRWDEMRWAWPEGIPAWKTRGTRLSP